jgi:hypothetical protein
MSFISLEANVVSKAWSLPHSVVLHLLEVTLREKGLDGIRGSMHHIVQV